MLPLQIVPGSFAPGPPICPTPAAGCPGCGGWCGLVENGAYEGFSFPTPTPIPTPTHAPRLGLHFLHHPEPGLMGRKFTDEQEQEIVRRYVAGESGYRLGATLGVTANTIGRILKRNGITTRSIREAKGGLTDEKESVVCALYQEGRTFYFLAETFGVSRNTISSILRRNGITIRSVTESRCGLTFELETEIGRRYLAGENTTQLGAAFSVTPTCISAVLKRNGVVARSLKQASGGLDDAQEDEVCNRYLAGENTAQLGEAFGIHPATIGKILKRKGVATRSLKEIQGGLSGEQEADVCSRYLAGESTLQLGKAFGVTKTTIGLALKRNGIRTRSIKESMGGLTDEQETEIGRRYLAGENTTQLGAAFSVTPTCICTILKRLGMAARSNKEALGGLNVDQEAEVCNRYLEGENTVQLGETFGVNSGTIGRILKRNGIERREAGGYHDSVQHAIDGTGRHSHARDCSFYIYDLPGQQGHSKPGISFDVKTRVKLAEGQYGEEHLLITYPTRQQAYFLEQAVLDATRGSAGRPEALLSWIGASEVRALPADDLVLIALHLADELEELGLWEFAVAYVPMTSAQRAICQQRALAGAPAFVTTTG